jgi:xanthine dehydrogenase accessory factor
MRALLQNLTDSLESGREVLLCQMVETKGSTPQKAGAMMIVDPQGGQVGTLGGGCVENEVKVRAIELIGTGRSEFRSYLLDHDYAWADGLICGGKMVMLSQSLRGLDPVRYFLQYRRLLDRGLGFTEMIVTDSSRHPGLPPGTRFLFDEQGEWVASFPRIDLPESVGKLLAPLAERPARRVREGVAVLPTLPRIRLIVVGAGHVGQSVAELAAKADFDVWVVDDRRQYANAERFPSAERLLVGPIDEVLRALEVNERSYVVIVTRGHGHDQEALAHFVNTSASYVGLIGSRRKIAMIFEELREMGVSDETLLRVAAPVGLDIGSETVPEIAVSIVAELIGRRNLGPRAVTPRQINRFHRDPVSSPSCSSMQSFPPPA